MKRYEIRYGKPSAISRGWPTTSSSSTMSTTVLQLFVTVVRVTANEMANAPTFFFCLVVVVLLSLPKSSAFDQTSSCLVARSEDHYLSNKRKWMSFHGSGPVFGRDYRWSEKS